MPLSSSTRFDSLDQLTRTKEDSRMVEWVDIIAVDDQYFIATGDLSSLRSLSFPYTDRGSAEQIAALEFPVIPRGGPSAIMKPLASWLGRYFSGEDPGPAPPVGHSDLSEFTQRVLRETSRIPWGEVLSYGELAGLLGNPRGARAVGGALGRNPTPIVVPCHRVLAARGELGGFGGGLCWKKRLLRIEGREL